MTTYTKDPNSKLDYTIDWASFLGDDTISASAWTVPSGITQSTPSPSNTSTTATIWLSGGTDGETYEVENQITSAAGRIDRRSIFIVVIGTTLGKQIAELRRMVAEPTEATYTDGALIEYIKRHRITDRLGTLPDYLFTYNPPVFADNPDWIASYDLNAAAATIWDKKAAAIANQYDFSADGASYQRTGKFEQYRKMARLYRSKSTPRTVRLYPDRGIPNSDDDYIGNN